MKLTDLMELLYKYRRDFGDKEVYTYQAGKYVPLEYFHIMNIGNKIII